MMKYAKAFALSAMILLAGCTYPNLQQQPRSENFHAFLELEAGRKVPDFQINDTSGALWRLSDHFGKLIVLQFASSTSPAFVASLNDFQREVLSRYQADDAVLFVYVFSTEAHPELLSPARRQELEQNDYKFRMDAARQYYYTLRFREGKRYDLSGMILAATNVVILVDDPATSASALYGYGRGGTTNPTFLIDEDGVLLAKGMSASDFLAPTGYLAGNLPVLIQAEMK